MSVPLRSQAFPTEKGTVNGPGVPSVPKRSPLKGEGTLGTVTGNTIDWLAMVPMSLFSFGGVTDGITLSFSLPKKNGEGLAW